MNYSYISPKELETALEDLYNYCNGDPMDAPSLVFMLKPNIVCKRHEFNTDTGFFEEAIFQLKSLKDFIEIQCTNCPAMVITNHYIDLAQQQLDEM